MVIGFATSTLKSSSTANLHFPVELKFWLGTFIVPQFGAVNLGSFRTVQKYPLKKQFHYFLSTLNQLINHIYEAGCCVTNNNKSENSGGLSKPCVCTMTSLLSVPVGTETCLENRKLKALDLFHVKMNFLDIRLVRHLLTPGETCFPRELEAHENHYSIWSGCQSWRSISLPDSKHIAVAGLSPEPCKGNSKKPTGPYLIPIKSGINEASSS